jgi:hypothetical protein
MTTMREARARYWKENNFGEDGGYSDDWVKIKVGPIPFFIPNGQARKKAVGFHDLHHILTGYQTDWAGEAEIAAWEVASGCRDMWAAWVLNLAAYGLKLPAYPKRVFQAFVRGRHSHNLYDKDINALLDQSTEEVQAVMGTKDAPPPATPSDRLAFTFWSVIALAVGYSPFLVLLGIGWWLFTWLQAT